MRYLASSAAVLLAFSSAACLEIAEFECSTNEDCTNGSALGVCQSGGRCSFADEQCASGQRFGGATAECVLVPDSGADAGSADRPSLDAQPDAAPDAEALDSGEDAGAGDLGVEDSGPTPSTCSISALAVGETTACVIRDDNRAYCWGSNDQGMAGYRFSGGVSDLPRVVINNDTGEPIEDVAELAMGRVHGCARQAGGQVLCFGGGWAGHLGVADDDADYPGAWPVQDAPGDLLNDATEIALGYETSCAKRPNGELHCWGDNGRGTLGRSSTVAFSHVPSPVVDQNGLPLATVDVFGGGNNHMCAVVEGQALCWGGNNDGELGDGTTENRDHAVPVGGLTGVVVEFALGDDHSCVRMADQTVWCWGNNSFGQLGTGSFIVTESLTPVQVVDQSGTPISGVESLVSGDDHVCATTGSGAVLCWGANEQGQLGDGTLPARPAADPVILADGNPIDAVVQLGAGYELTCALRDSDPLIMCWGSNENDALGRFESDLARSVNPISIDACRSSCVDDPLEIAAGNFFSCLRTVGGRVQCSGSANSNRFAGDVVYGETTESFLVRNADGSPLENIEQLELGDARVCGRTSTANVICWGYNSDRRLGVPGDGSYPTAVVDEQGNPLTGVSDIALWWEHGCAALNDGTVWCWGRNDDGELGDGTLVSTSSAVQANITDVARIAVGETHTCAVKNNGSVWCWGDNNSLQLGAETGTNMNPNPIEVLDAVGASLTGVQDVEIGHDYSCLVRDDATVACWGGYWNGKLGFPTDEDRTVPGTVINASGGPLGNVTKISAGDHTTCAVTTGGSVHCWGYGRYGIKGDGLETDRAFATTVLGGSSYVDVTVGLNFACAITDSGATECWGKNDSSMLGRSSDTILQSLVPVTAEYSCP